MKQILAVDNHPLMLKFIAEHFKKRGHEVATATDGLSALQWLETHIPDVVFVDLVMENISGDKLCKIIRNRPALNRCFIVVLSALVAEEQISVSDFSADLLLAKGPFGKLSDYLDFILWHVEEDRTDRLKGCIIGQEGLSGREITRELLDATRHYEKILDHMSEGILELADDNRIIYANPAAVSITGIPEKTLLSMDFVRLCQKKQWNSVEEHLALVREAGHESEPDRLFEINERKVYLKMIPVAHRNKRQSLLVMARDVTERNRAEAKLIEHQAALEQTNLALAKRVDFERLIAETSSHLIGLRPEDMDEGIVRALSSIGGFTGADRAYLFLGTKDGLHMDRFHHWCSEGVESQNEKLRRISLEELPWLFEQIKTRGVLHIGDAADLPIEAKATKDLMTAQRICSLLIVPMISAERLIGFLGFDTMRKPRSWTAEDQAVLGIVGESFAHLIERRRTENALRDSEKKLRLLSDRLIRAQEKERRRIALELHDELGQSLMALKLQLRSLYNGLHDMAPGLQSPFLDSLAYIDEITEKVRRISSELRPAILEDLGLPAALNKLAEDTMKHSSLQIHTDMDYDHDSVSYEQEVLLFRIFQEALTNILKHAGAKRAWLKIRQEGIMLLCTIIDDGRGLPERPGCTASPSPAGLGFNIMEERGRMLQAELSIESPGKGGTCIAFKVPLETEEE